MMVTKYGEFTRSRQIVHLGGMDLMMYKLHFKNTVDCQMMAFNSGDIFLFFWHAKIPWPCIKPEAQQ